MNALADVMAHDPATARDYYFKEDARMQAMAAHERMRDAYGLGKAAESQHMAAAANEGSSSDAVAGPASLSFTQQSPPDVVMPLHASIDAATQVLESSQSPIPLAQV